MRSVPFAVAALVVGCGPPALGVDAGPPPCDVESGTYRVVYVQTSGTCPGFDGIDVILESGPGAPFPGASSECSGSVEFTDDGCAVEFDRTCDVYDVDGFRIGTDRWRGVSTIVSPVRVEAGVGLDFSGVDPSDSCTGGYEISWTRR